MKTVLRAIVWICMVILMLGASWGQTDDAANAADVSGRWLGSFDVVRLDGTVDPDNAVFVLKQTGAKVTGTAGQSEDRMNPLTQGDVTNQTVHFTMLIHQNVEVKFNLKVDGDRLRGEATGLPGTEPGSTVVVNVARWPQGSTAPKITHAQDILFFTIPALDTIAE